MINYNKEIVLTNFSDMFYRLYLEYVGIYHYLQLLYFLVVVNLEIILLKASECSQFLWLSDENFDFCPNFFRMTALDSEICLSENSCYIQS